LSPEDGDWYVSNYSTVNDNTTGGSRWNSNGAGHSAPYDREDATAAAVY